MVPLLTGRAIGRVWPARLQICPLEAVAATAVQALHGRPAPAQCWTEGAKSLLLGVMVAGALDDLLGAVDLLPKK